MGHFMMDDQNIFAWLCTSCVLCCFMGCAYIFYIIVTIILPPLPVFIRHHCEVSQICRFYLVSDVLKRNKLVFISCYSFRCLA
ncbi:Os09g0322400 [Oryza sativa Japonica Group]|uniref:Os09g0322400 protein n=2 Tax=Oryza sativa subsp. japonica TaxID=39947 RepID=Q0J2N5_ORYSJ|nr:Os09g0322400 [Oryza sativa Japonica Group]BAT07448.1 Os09g0322400 [Oryza sativa Japonica Group]|eukprot:NP_001062864.1 Os09g0322400 [Oryza sativa Japonica Group]